LKSRPGDAIRRIVDSKNTDGFDTRNLHQRLSVPMRSAARRFPTPEQMRELHLTGKLASRITAEVNPSAPSLRSTRTYNVSVQERVCVKAQNIVAGTEAGLRLAFAGPTLTLR
jgi:hypothetical protein